MQSDFKSQYFLTEVTAFSFKSMHLLLLLCLIMLIHSILKLKLIAMPYCSNFAVERFEESEDRALVQMLTNQDATSKGKITLQLM